MAENNCNDRNIFEDPYAGLKPWQKEILKHKDYINCQNNRLKSSGFFKN